MPDVFFHLPESLTRSPRQPHSTRTLTLLYFIPGNPGLIEYYVPFLTLLAKKSEEWTGKGRDFGIAGVSLGGFEAATPSSPRIVNGSTGTASDARGDEEAEEDLLPLYPPSFPRKQGATYTLRDQIELSYARITTLVSRLQSRETDGSISVEVILAGHSVGAYIALEAINLHHHEHYSSQPYRSTSISTSTYTTLSTLLLTPTILNISHSPSGRIATPLLSYLPFLPAFLQLGASGLVGTLPTTWTRGLVQRVTGMKSSGMVDVTAAFLGRSGAVRQALELAGREMREIGEGSWEGAVWGVVEGTKEGEDGIKDVRGGEERAGGEKDGSVEGGSGIGTGKAGAQWKSPVHHFLFAKGDHWVADETRETIIKSMGGRAKILVDEGELGLVHAWCLEQSEMVAGIVSGWIEDMLFGNR